jgi:hypothetical protein
VRIAILGVLLLALIAGGCGPGNTVTEEDARNFSKTPDGKGDDGRDAVNNLR